MSLSYVLNIFLVKYNHFEVFWLPHFQTERYKPIATEVSTRFGPSQDGTIIRVIKTSTTPNISSVEALDRRSNFSLFNPYHQQLAGTLIEIFMSMYQKREEKANNMENISGDT